MNNKGEVALGIVFITILSVYLIGWIRGYYDFHKTNGPSIDIASQKVTKNVLDQ